MKLHEIDETLKEIAPIHGVNSNGVIWFAAVATDAQKKAARAKLEELLPLLEKVEK